MPSASCARGTIFALKLGMTWYGLDVQTFTYSLFNRNNNSIMPHGVHKSNWPSGCHQRKAKKKRCNSLKSLSGSMLRYVEKSDDGQSSSNNVPQSTIDTDSFDASSMHSLEEQVVQKINKIDDEIQKLKEVLPGVFPLSEKKDDDLSSDILTNLKRDGLDIMMCGAQGYDNAATMSEIHGGVQAIL
ncbi:hypothetical protein CHS0354_016742 [Potamilus streckersoni]|uniref:Uncharacterized protein n=1 Tax=Potamilus streckersoni TaxID=2493646 RepID=A0AAE0TCB2_9BIVA|nr:hypothetical protein CHS0354_016742 [Potamilus streckersoni]